MTYLDFEQPVAELDTKIEELESLGGDVDLGPEIRRLRKKSDALICDLYSHLTPWQCALVARHPQRPYTLDYIAGAMTGFAEMHGDRAFADDKAIVGGTAWLGGRAVMVIGHQKGRDIKERTFRNFGMPSPEGYRKALRLMKTAERFGMPIITLIDTPGAYPGIGAEERGQSEAIGRNLYEMSRLTVPVIATVIGEGGSGGALAIALADSVMMLSNSIYSVISPEGCASILWKDAAKAPDACAALSLTSARLAELGLVDRVLPEPAGGAHRDPAACISTWSQAVCEELDRLCRLSEKELLERRHRRLMAYGRFAE